MADQFSEEQIRAIAAAIDKKASTLMPKLHEIYSGWDGLMNFKAEATETLMATRSTLSEIERQYVDKDTFHTHNHKLVRLQSEVEFHKKQYSVEKLESINAALNQIETMRYDSNVLKMSLELKSDQEELYRCFKKFKLYCPMSAIDEIRD